MEHLAIRVIRRGSMDDLGDRKGKRSRIRETDVCLVRQPLTYRHTFPAEETTVFRRRGHRSCKINLRQTQKSNVWRTKGGVELSKVCLPLTNDSSRLAQQMAHALDNLNLCYSWYAYIPYQLHLNRDNSLDAVARAVVCAHECSINDSEANRRKRMLYYLRALELVREHLSTSDEILLCCAMLALFENLAGSPIPTVFQHIGGIEAIMEARARASERQTSELARSIIHATSNERFRIACALGVPSPFEGAGWLDLEPASRNSSLSPAASRLRKLVHQLWTRLPRLLVQVRSCREHVQLAGPLIENAVAHARELSQLQDKIAEDEVLHQIRIVSTLDQSYRAIMSVSYEFPSLEDMEAAVLYWQARLILIKLCATLDKLRETAIFPLHDSSTDLIDVSADQTRLVANLIMSWQALVAADVLRKEMTQCFVVLWGAIADMEIFRGKPVFLVRSYILERFRSVSPEASLGSHAALMDESSDYLAGGLRLGVLRGVFEDLNGNTISRG